MHQDLEVQQELQEHKDLKGLQEKLVNQDWLVLKATLGQAAPKEKLGTKEQLEHEAAMDQKVLSEQLGQLEALEPQDEWEKQEKLDLMEKMVFLAHKV